MNSADVRLLNLPPTKWLNLQLYIIRKESPEERMKYFDFQLNANDGSPAENRQWYAAPTAA